MVGVYRGSVSGEVNYPPLATDTEENNCFSIYYDSEIIEHKNDEF